jgi:virulence-associated protein VapD
MAAGRKQVAFDLDTNLLKIYYPVQNWRKAYEDISRHMETNGFSWRQGSVYVSEGAMSSRDVTETIEKFVGKNLWLNVCMRDCVVTNIGKEHSLNHLFDKNARVQAREDRNTHETMSDYKAGIAARRAAADSAKRGVAPDKGRER